MKLFMATLATETNTFSPIPTGHAAFTGGREYSRDNGSREAPSIGNLPLRAWRTLGEADGHTVVESICTFAQPAGTTLQHVYEGLRDTILEDLRAAMPVGRRAAVHARRHGRPRLRRLRGRTPWPPSAPSSAPACPSA